MNASVGLVASCYTRGLDAVAATVLPFLSRVRPSPIVRLKENEAGELVLQSIGTGVSSPGVLPVSVKPGHKILPHELESLADGNRVEVILPPARFLFRPLELPSRAQDFLSDIVRTQIDRLTPWTVSAAAFGWSPPVREDDQRIKITVAATALAGLQPLVSSLSGAGAGSIALYAAPPAESTDVNPIKVYEEQCTNAGLVGLRRLLTTILAVTAFTAIGAFGLWSIVGGRLATEQNELLRAAAGRALSTEAGARAFLQRRKHDQLPIVLLVEKLAQLLPDDTHATELSVQGRALRVSGITRDAPAIIRLLEQSRQFSKVRFFAPTTQTSGERGARFHIEAEIQPLGAPRS